MGPRYVTRAADLALVASIIVSIAFPTVTCSCVQHVFDSAMSGSEDVEYLYLFQPSSFLHY